MGRKKKIFPQRRGGAETGKEKRPEKGEKAITTKGTKNTKHPLSRNGRGDFFISFSAPPRLCERMSFPVFPCFSFAPSAPWRDLFPRAVEKIDFDCDFDLDFDEDVFFVSFALFVVRISCAARLLFSFPIAPAWLRFQM